MDNKIIEMKALEFIALETTQLKTDRVLDDLTGLYGDIRVELFQKAPDSASLIDEYANMLAREQQICTPKDAYTAGHNAAQASHECNPAEYIAGIYRASDNQCLFSERDSLFHTLCNLLGDTRGLLSEYTELYRQYHGTINNKIDVFYQWGYDGKLPNCDEKAS